MSVVLPRRLVQRRARATVSHFFAWILGLPCFHVALAGHTYRWPVGGAGATPPIRFPPPHARVSTTPLPDSDSSPPTVDPVLLDAQVDRASSLDWVSTGSLMLSPCACGSQRVQLADDDAEDTGDVLGPYHVEGERGQSAVVRTIDEELPIYGVPEICNECPSRFCPCRRHPRYAVIVDLLSRQRWVRVRVLLERIRLPVAAVLSGIPSQAEGHRSLGAVCGHRAVSLGVGCVHYRPRLPRS